MSEEIVITVECGTVSQTFNEDGMIDVGIEMGTVERSLFFGFEETNEWEDI